MNYIFAIFAGIGLVSANIGWMAERAAHANTKAAHAEYIAQADRKARALSERNRSIEQELTNAHAIHAKEAAALREQADSNRLAAGAAGKRLQDAARNAAGRARAQCAGAAVADLRDTAGDPIGMLGRVLAELDETAQSMADHADAARVAGLACQREYNAVREAVNAVK